MRLVVGPGRLTAEIECSIPPIRVLVVVRVYSLRPVDNCRSSDRGEERERCCVAGRASHPRLRRHWAPSAGIEIASLQAVPPDRLNQLLVEPGEVPFG